MSELCEKHSFGYEPLRLGILTPMCPLCLQDENKWLKEEIAERKKQLEAAFEILEEYTPAEKLQEANDKMILLCKGTQEKMGREILKETK